MRMPRASAGAHRTSRARPRVLLADDHAAIVVAVSRLLSDVCDVVGIARDGRQALELTLQLAPDVVVLDLLMPHLDGLQVVRELQRSRSSAKVVLLTMCDTDEDVRVAMRAGAHAYVTKVRVYVDLVAAIDCVLAGRTFVPSLASMAATGAGHTALFHTNHRQFVDEAARVAAAAMRSKAPVAVIGTEITRNGLAERLEAQGLDVAAVIRSGLYRVGDAAEALAGIMRGDRVDAAAFAETAHALESARRTFGDASSPRLTILGDLTTSLCRAGRFEAAVEVERTWSRLTNHLPFFTVCSYPADCFHDPADTWSFPAICGEHKAITHGARVTY